MESGAKPMSPTRGFLPPAPKPGGLWAVAQAVGQMMLLPWNVLASLTAGMARLVDGAKLTAGSGLERMPTPPPATRDDERTTSGAVSASAGTTTHKETRMSYEDRCEVADDCQIKLYSYTIVNIRRGAERILLRSEKLVTDPMDQCEFDAWVIAEYLQSEKFRDEMKHEDPRKRPIEHEHDKRWLRVSSSLQHTWGKQPLHYHEMHLRLLEKIADRLPERADRTSGETT
jgi:hypothetical protein